MTMCKPEGARKQQTTKWCVHTYLYADDHDTLPLGEDVVNGVKSGGRRNYGHGVTQLKESQRIDLNVLEFTRFGEAEVYLIELVTPFVGNSEYPNTDLDIVP
jgi:hypothetical protein